MNRRTESLGLVAVAVLVLGLLAFQFLPSSTASSNDVDTSVSSSQTADAGSSGVVYDRTISVDELPPEATDTLRLIDSDGPFPYRKDGSTFQNREGRLPERSQGHYREFTVETPGSPDRGARRIVAGDEGELYWTADHYDSFAQIIGW